MLALGHGVSHLSRQFDFMGLCRILLMRLMAVAAVSRAGRAAHSLRRPVVLSEKTRLPHGSSSSVADRLKAAQVAQVRLMIFMLVSFVMIGCCR